MSSFPNSSKSGLRKSGQLPLSSPLSTSHTWNMSCSGAVSPSPVLLSRPSKDGFARLDGRFGKIARLTPVFLWFCPSFCDLVHVQSVNELLSKINYVATRLRHLERIRWHVEWKLPPNELSPKIVLIYALLLLKCRESNLRAFLIHNLNFARLCARLTPVFLLKKRPYFARLFTKMSPSEELVTLQRIVCFIHGNRVMKNYTSYHHICWKANGHVDH